MKKIHQIIVLVLFTSLITISCEKDFYTTVKGKVIDLESGTPVEGFILSLTEQESFKFIFPETLDFIVTDSLGEFQYDFEAENHMHYYIESIDNEEYLEIDREDVNVGEINEYLFEVQPTKN